MNDFPPRAAQAGKTGPGVARGRQGSTLLAEPTLTVLTPTWNRALLLARLARSINAELPNEHFVEWLVVDDGSSDATGEPDAAWRCEAPDGLRYVRIAHGGKHRALNAGFERARGAWIVVIDSDDRLMEGGLARMVEVLREAERAGAQLACIPVEVVGRERQHRFQLPDRCLTYTRMLAEEPWFDTTLALSASLPDLRFPEIPGETFIAEGALLHALPAGTGVYLAGAICVRVEYQPGGLSARMLEVRMASPRGAALVPRLLLRHPLRLALELRALANFGRFWWHAAVRGRMPLAPETMLQALFIPVGLPFALVDILSHRARR